MSDGCSAKSFRAGGEQQDILTVLGAKELYPRMLYPAGLTGDEGETNTIPGTRYYED